MSLLHNLIELIYPSPYTRERLDKIPSAPVPALSFVFSLFDYHSKEGKALVYFVKKYHNARVSKLIAERMADYVKEYLAEQHQFSYYLNPLVVMVPLSSQSKRIRGFNQNEKIARYFAKQISGQYLGTLVIKTKHTQKQALLKHKNERIKNIRNAFSVKENKKSELLYRDVIIIDDLVTTGATLEEMKRILLRAGARNVIAVTLAH